MPCYHPRIAFPTELLPSGKWKFVPSCPPENPSDFLKNYRGYQWPGWKPGMPDPVLVPCKKCFGCRLDYSRLWADRMMLEYDHWHKAIFLTLTYDNEHVVPVIDPATGEYIHLTLWKKDVSDFLKRLRGRKRFEDRKIRFFCSGEYGEHTARPHYHLIIFNVSVEDFPDREYHGRNELNQVYFASEELAQIWNKGFILLAETSWNTFAYVSRYVLKKSRHWFHPDFLGCAPEFSLMSRNPGLGAFYFEDHPEFKDLDVLYIEGCDKDIRVPKYNLDRLYKDSPEEYAVLKQQRRQGYIDAQLVKLSQTTISELEVLENQENSKLGRIGSIISDRLVESDDFDLLSDLQSRIIHSV